MERSVGFDRSHGPGHRLEGRSAPLLRYRLRRAEHHDMGGDLVVVLVVRVAPEYGVLGAHLAPVWSAPAGCSRASCSPWSNLVTLAPKLGPDSALGDLADRLGGSGRGVVHQDVPSVGSAGISSAMA
jgi:hypothetical protein